MIEILTVQAAVFCKHVPDTARNFAADSDSSVAVFHTATLNDHVLRRCIEAASIGISSRLDRDAIVAGVERTIFDQYIRTRLGITTVVIGSMTVDLHIPDRNIRAQHRM